jgi:hypothetical protein
VSAVRTSTQQQGGLVTVKVPMDMIADGEPFSFRLPAEVADAPTAAVRVSLTSGLALPAWLRYDAGSGTFAASGVSAKLLPIDVLVSVGQQRWTVTIAAKSAN